MIFLHYFAGMRIGIEDLRAFILVADMKSFVRAADELALTQSALSRRLKKLEDILGAKVLDRTSRSVALTAVGEEFMPAARRMIRDYERSVADIQDVIEKRAGLVSMATIMTVAHNALPRVLQRFHADYPAIRVRVLDDVGPKAVEFVADGDAEFGIALEAGDRPHIDYEPIVEDGYILACHRKHPLAQKRRVRWKDLAEHSYISMGPETGNQIRLVRALEEDGLLPRPAYEVQHLSTMMGLLSHGLGVTAVPRLSVADRPMGDLVFRPLVEPAVSRYIGIVQVAGKTLSPAADALRAIAVDELRSMAEARPDAA